MGRLQWQSARNVLKLQNGHGGAAGGTFSTGSSGGFRSDAQGVGIAFIGSSAPRNLFWTFILHSSTAHAADFTGQVVSTADGDPITVLHRGLGQKIRLNGPDCPEKGPAAGQRAKQHV